MKKILVFLLVFLLVGCSQGPTLGDHLNASEKALLRIAVEENELIDVISIQWYHISADVNESSISLIGTLTVDAYAFYIIYIRSTDQSTGYAFVSMFNGNVDGYQLFSSIVDYEADLAQTEALMDNMTENEIYISVETSSGMIDAIYFDAILPTQKEIVQYPTPYDDATILVLNQSDHVDLNLSTEIKIFVFIPSETSLYTFYSTGDNDTSVELSGVEEIVIDSDDDSGDAYNFMLTASLTAGVTYYYIVESYDSIASFDVMLVQGTYVEYVFNEATLIEPDEQKELTHDAQHEMTVLQFTPATSDYHTFFTPNDENIVFTLYNQNGDELFQVSGQNTDDYLKLTLLLSQGQAYYLVIETAFDASTTFDVAVVTGMGPTGSPFTQTVSMVSGDRQSITLNEDNEYKVIISFTPTVSGYYTLTSYAPSQNMVYDTYCDLFDSFGSMIGTHDDQYPNLNFALRYNLVAGQTYYYQVRNWYTQTVTFDIELMPS